MAEAQTESGRYTGLAMLTFAACMLSWINFADWNQAVEVPFAIGISGVSFGRVAAIASILLLVVALLAAIAGRTLTALFAASRALLVFMFVGMLALAVALEGSGKLRKAAIGVFGKVPGGMTRLQVHHHTIRQIQDDMHRMGGPVQPLAFYLGTWRRHESLLRYDVRRFTVREEGGRVMLRAWNECRPGGALCDLGEVPAVLEKAQDGHVQGITGAFPTDYGRVWMTFHPGRYKSQPTIMATHVYLATDPMYQVSGRGMSLVREGQPAPLAAFAGEWRRAGQAREGELTHVTLTPAGAQVRMRVWYQCGRQECDVGEVSAQPEVDGDLVRVISATFRGELRELNVMLGLMNAGQLEVLTEAAAYGTSTVTGRRGGTHTYTSSRSASNARAEFVRAGG